ncbi:glycosyltransferase family 2 protein [Thermococcus gammatolerans]|uniref:Dolichol-phosphate mannosyltransferase n=1 Tax=Thermococcus gammatolerans (strain DSM 15229 / JCM 11827 / EJ3) TaxID=593117 RepID=C5A6Y9_THEGJ|nr:glycosyltransferase family 2 protein [Thermococcus gammatolerans]ACS34001.1 Dolichol-phosphate mannosyltransferase [Thermococcus gammatolerans EJ3]
MLKGKKISVIIPAYNEEDRLPRVLEGIPAFVDEVIVIDDGSLDGTYNVAKAFAEKDTRIKAIRLEKNCGKGCAMREGIRHSTGDIVVFMDADGQHRPGEIIKLVEPIAKGEADMVIGARRIQEVGKRPWVRRLSNVITTRLIRLKLRTYVYDTQSGFRAYRREFLPEIESDRYEVETEMLIKAAKMGARIKEVPVSMIYDPRREGRFSVRDVFRFVRAYLKF